MTGFLIYPKVIMRFLPVLLLALVAAGCTSSNRLAEYDFRKQTVAVVSDLPPHPDVFTDSWWMLGGESENFVAALFEVGSHIAKNVSADEARKRLDLAASHVDVVTLLTERVERGTLTTLRAMPSDDERTADLVLEIRVNKYGIEAASWSSRAYFKVEADVWLLDGQTGERVWRRKVKEKDPITPDTWMLGSTLSNVVTADALARLSVEEMEVALESLAAYAADRIVYKLRKDFHRAKE